MASQNNRMQNNRHWTTVWAITLAVILFLTAMHQYYVSTIAPDVPYMDTLRLIFQIDDWQAGKSTLFQLWGGHAAHRGLIMQAVLLTNIGLFDLDIGLANRLTGVVILSCSALLVSTFLRDRRALAVRPYTRTDWLVLTSAAIVLGAVGFGLAGFELLTLDLGLSQWLKNLVFLLIFGLYGRLLSDPSIKRATLLSLLIPITVLFIGMGWSFAFVAAIALVHAIMLTTRRRSGIAYQGYVQLPLLSAGLSIALYALGGASDNAESTSLAPVGQMLPLLIVMPFYSVASGFIGIEAIEHMQLPHGLLLSVGIAASALAAYGLGRRWLRGMSSASLLPVYAITYSALFMASIAVARGDDGIATIMSSRYYMEVILFVAGVVWLLAEDIVCSAKPERLTTAIYAVLVLALAGGYAISGYREWKTMPYRAYAFEVMRSRLASGIMDQEMADLLQSPLPHASRGVQVLTQRRLSLFRGDQQRLCSGKLGFRDGWYPTEPAGNWSGNRARLHLPPCDCDTLLNFSLPAPLPARVLSVRDGAGAVVQNLAMAPGDGASVRLPVNRSWSTWTLSVSRTTIPSRDLPDNLDSRELGVLLIGYSHTCPDQKAKAQ